MARIINPKVDRIVDNVIHANFEKKAAGEDKRPPATFSAEGLERFIAEHKSDWE